MRPDRDLVVLGGGCAGLSLAERLATAGAGAPRTLVLEAREAYADDRTWCFWRTRPHRTETLVRAAWDRVAIETHDGRGGVVETPRAPYQMIRGADFYDAARRAIDASERVDLRLGARVGAATAIAGGLWRVETDSGPLTARHVVDTRPDRRPARGGARLWQSFAGREIAVDAPVFDPRTATLMRFLPPRPDRVAFTYVLPLAPDRALVEATAFCADPLAPAALDADLAQAVDVETGGRGGVTLRREGGCLPMGIAGAAPRALGPGHVRAGLTAGGARPSSGYAFRRIQAWAEICALTLCAGGAPVPAPADAPLPAFMDRLFLEVLAADPARGPGLFAALARRTPPMRLVRFLSDEPSPLDAAALAASLPPAPFLRALVRGRRAAPVGAPAPGRVGEARR